MDAITWANVDPDSCRNLASLGNKDPTALFDQEAIDLLQS